MDSQRASTYAFLILSALLLPPGTVWARADEDAKYRIPVTPAPQPMAAAPAAPPVAAANQPSAAVQTLPPVIAGIAAFVEERVEAELRAWATDAVVASICRDEEVARYFPQTCKLTDADGSYRDIYSVPGADHLLIAALRRDGRNLPMHVIRERVLDGQNRHPELVAAWQLYDLVDALRARDVRKALGRLTERESLYLGCAAAPPDGRGSCSLLKVSIVVQALSTRGRNEEESLRLLRDAARNLIASPETNLRRVGQDLNALANRLARADSDVDELVDLRGRIDARLAGLADSVEQHRPHLRVSRHQTPEEIDARNTALAAILSEVEALLTEAVLAFDDEGMLEHLEAAIAEAKTFAGVLARFELRAHRAAEQARLIVEFVDQLRRGRQPLELLVGLGKTRVILDACAETYDTRTDPSCRILFASAVITAVRESGLEPTALGRAMEGVANKAPWTDGTRVPESLRVELLILAGQLQRGETQGGTALALLANLETQVKAIEGGVVRVREARAARDRQTEVAEIVALVVSLRDLLVAAGLIEQQQDPVQDPLSVEWVTAMAHLALGDFHAALFEIANSADCGRASKQRLCSVLPVAMTIASADDAKEVESVLEAYAAPLGSWRGRQTQMMTSLAAWPAMAYERAGWGSGTDKSGGTIVAPLGITRSWPVRSNDGYFGGLPALGSHAVMLSLLDIGYALRREDSENTGAGQIDPERYDSVSDFVSLGLYYRVTFRSTPLMVGVGYSYSPNQRTETVAGVTREADTARWLVFVGIEVTLFPL